MNGSICLLAANAIFRHSWHTEIKVLGPFFRHANASNLSASGGFLTITRDSAPPDPHFRLAVCTYNVF